ncbi:probable glutamate--tRNA ligase, mitochondrial isoform X2 [Athalia rosae]|uniref:probable glutamate--tRNA ligase, mitochondrial isoform X2 n=2 Tax=Athalia rosae TaxID=37344 RepID=UPI00203385B3|nr:probable glutamate--tRNA ligase, mitochondrial isoform X2 [Athalia rosae]
MTFAGYLHLGGLHTALCNMVQLYISYSNQGNYILRLEDTDQTGLVPDAAGKLQVRQRESYCDSFKVQETCLAGDSTRRGKLGS